MQCNRFDEIFDLLYFKKDLIDIVNFENLIE